MRALLLASIVTPIIAGTSLALVACASISELTVGSTPADPDAGADTSPSPASPDAMLTTTLLDKLEAKCAAQAGAIDSYTNAAELSDRLKGRWYHCGSLGNWTLPRGTGLEYLIDPNGHYEFVSYDDKTETFTPSTDVTKVGELLYIVFTGTPSDGGAEGGDASVQSEAGGAGPMFINVDDTTTRNGIFVYLTRATDTDLEFQMLFEQNPRKLHMNELGGTPVLATFVPID